MKKKVQKQSHDPQEFRSLPFYDINTTVSATECTGIAPSGISQQDEAEAIGELYDIHTPQSSKQLKKAEQSCHGRHRSGADLDISPDE